MLASKCLLYQEAVCKSYLHTVDKAFISSHRLRHRLSSNVTKLHLYTVHSYVELAFFFKLLLKRH